MSSEQNDLKAVTQVVVECLADEDVRLQTRRDLIADFTALLTKARADTLDSVHHCGNTVHCDTCQAVYDSAIRRGSQAEKGIEIE